MLAILSNTIENADRLSDSLQHYWSARGVYRSIALYETESALLTEMASRLYDSIILERIDNLPEVIAQIRSICPACKIAVVIESKDPEQENEIALTCYRLNVEMMLSRAEFELPLAKLSKRLCVL